jgi:RNA polymerase sigma-70 factor (ECF subfamily)
MDFVFHLDKEEEFIAACIRNERWAQGELYKKYYPSMMAVCLRYSNDKEDALDILHEGFIKVFKHIKKYQQGTSLAAWIKRIMVNTAIDHYRKRIRRRSEDLSAVYNVQSNAPDVVSQMSAEEIIECLQHLSPSYRAVFNLYVIEGYAHKEIAKQLGISESTSRSNLVKARTKLKALLLRKSMVYGS